jgi:hypothetical protein
MEINLSNVKISEDSVHTLLSQCTLLERLTVNFLGTFDRLHIRSPSLKVLNSTGKFEELFIDDAPNLEYLDLVDSEAYQGLLQLRHGPPSAAPASPSYCSSSPSRSRPCCRRPFRRC